MKKPKILATTFAQYNIVGTLGQGGSGIVYSARDDDGGSFAVKILDPTRATSEKLKRFKNEFAFCSKSDHENLIKVLDHGLSDESAAFFVMPAYESSLRPLIGKLAEGDAFQIFLKLLNGVEAAHKLGVVHRDLKPENILLNDRGRNLVVADFGIARFEEEDLFTAVETKDSTRLANFQYAAPEQKTRGKDVDKPADIYALGLMLNELFTGEIAHGTKYIQIGDVAPNFSYLDVVVERMLMQAPDGRFESIDAVKREIIARGGEFVVLQKLSKTKKEVVAIDDPDDPLVDDPIRIVAVDWNDNLLIVTLNHQVSQDWVWAINNMGGHTAVLGKGPENFRFEGNRAMISANSAEAQHVVEYFKQWLPQANRTYADKVRGDRAAKEKKLQAELANRIKSAEERLRVLGSLKF